LGDAEAAGKQRLGDARHLAGIVTGDIGKPVHGLDPVEHGNRAPELMAQEVGVPQDPHHPLPSRDGQMVDLQLQHPAQGLEDRHAVGEPLERSAHHSSDRGTRLKARRQDALAQIAVGDDAGRIAGDKSRARFPIPHRPSRLRDARLRAHRDGRPRHQRPDRGRELFADAGRLQAVSRPEGRIELAHAFHDPPGESRSRTMAGGGDA
jgi:hypothetical protein